MYKLIQPLLYILLFFFKSKMLINNNYAEWYKLSTYKMYINHFIIIHIKNNTKVLNKIHTIYISH